MKDYEYGQEILVKDSENEKWKKRLYIAKYLHGVICTQEIHRDEVLAGEPIFMSTWKHHKPYSRKVKSNVDIVKELIARGFEPDSNGNWENGVPIYSPSYLFNGLAKTKPEWMLEDE